MSRPSASRLMAVLAVLAAPAAAGPVAFGPDLAAQGWQQVTVFGQRPAEFAADGAEALRIRSDRGGSTIWRPLPPELAQAGTAEWRWRVDAGVPPTGDHAIALCFLFADNRMAAARPPGSLREALRAGRALIYAWGGDAERGSVIASPGLGGRGRQIVARPASTPTGTWFVDRVDLGADFRRAFGRDPGPLIGVAVSSDSDGTGTTTEGALADLVIR